MVDGGRESVEDGLLCFGGRTVAGDYERDGEVVAVDELLGELGERDEVAHSRTRVHSDVGCLYLRHFCIG